MAADLQSSLTSLLSRLLEAINNIPGGSIVIRYIRSSYQNDPFRSAIELFLFLFAVRYLLAPSYSTNKSKERFVRFTEREVDDLVEDWTPEPLVGGLTAEEEGELERRPVIVGPTGPKSRLSNGRTVTNLASYNFYNFVSNETLKEKAIATLRYYGVGPCSPPGFYGTQDVHMKTEQDITAHLGTAACIVYAQAFSTISSVIPAFSKRGDIIVADNAVGFAVRKGIQISRSMVYFYEHNNMEDLERVLKMVVKQNAKKPLTRRFIVTEGLFESVGDMADLPTLIELKLRYKFRLILDETWSYGVLGRTGRGLTEQQNVDPTLVDMIIGSLAGPLCAGGGFCAGSTDIVEHQRISSAAYTFSAALPALLATTASETILILQEQPENITFLRDNIKAMRAQVDTKSEFVRALSVYENPVQIFSLKPEVVEAKRLSDDEQDLVMQEIVDECLANNVMITRVRKMPPPLGVSARDQGWQPSAGIKVCATTGLSRKDIEKAGTVIRHAVTKVVSRRR